MPATEIFSSVVDYHPPVNKWVNSSIWCIVEDENRTNRVLLGRCAWPRHAYRHVQTLTRRCGFLAVLPLRATGGKGKRSLLWFALPAGHGQYVLACPRRGQALRPEVGHTPQNFDKTKTAGTLTRGKLSLRFATRNKEDATPPPCIQL